MSEVLTVEKVESIFSDCLFKKGEDTSECAKAEGVTLTVGFHPQRLESHRSKIEEMLEELPDEFQQARGGGWSFLNACKTKEGAQWTGLHQIVEQLILLGIGLGKVEFLLPREVWEGLPGGLPYLVVTS